MRLALVGLFMVGAAGVVAAQEEPPQEAEADRAQLDEIVVTAQKRAQNIQDVPLSMSVVGGDAIRTKQIDNMSNLANYTPNVNIVPSNAGGTIRVRGLGSMANDGFEQSVGFYIDDIYYARTAYIPQGFLDLDRVEVLRGPQGTLFGKNTVAGAVNIHTSNPSHDWEVQADVGFGTDEAETQTLVVNVPLLEDTLAFRLAGTNQQRDGYVFNTFRELSESATDKINIRGKVLWDVTAKFNIVFAASHARTDDTGPGFELTQAAEVTRLLVAARDPDGDFIANWRGSTDTDAIFETENTNYSLHADLEWGDHGLKLVASHSAFEQLANFDADGGPMPFLQWNNFDDFDQSSAELQLISPEGRLEYVAGLYYYRNTYHGTTDFRIGNFDNGTEVFLGIGLPPALQGLLAQQISDSIGGQLGVDDLLGTALSDRLDQTFIQDTTTYAIFGQLTGEITDDLTVVVGARYSYEIKDAFISQRYVNSGVLLRVGLGLEEYELNEERTEENIAPKISFQYDLREHLMVYATVAQGHKAGGFNPFAENPGNARFGPEESTTIEAGAKGRFFDSRAEVNLSLFRTEFDDLQVSIVGGTGSTFIVGNAAKATSQGLELDGQVMIFPGLIANGAIGWTDAVFDSFPNSPCIASATGDPNGCDASGKRLTEAPEWNGHLGLNWVLPFDAIGLSGFDAALLLGGDGLYQGETFMNLDYDPASFRPAVWRYSARIGVVDTEGRWAFLINGSNLTDEKFLILSVDVHQIISLFAEFGIDLKDKRLHDIGTGNGLIPRLLLELTDLGDAVGSDPFLDGEHTTSWQPHDQDQAFADNCKMIRDYCGNILDYDKYSHLLAHESHSMVPRSVAIPEQPAKSYRFLQASVHDLPVDDEIYDLFYCKAIEHINDWPGFFRAIAKSANPGAVIYLKHRSFYSFLGPHRYSTLDIPWGHLLLSDDDFRRCAQERFPDDADKMIDFYFNELTYPRQTVPDMVRIAGEEGFSPDGAQKVLEVMSPRGPDFAKLEAKSDFAVGHVRLSILDPAPRAHQPMWDQDQRFVLTYNGEIYNCRDLAKRLTDMGVTLRTSSDTEVLLELCKAYGVKKTLRLLNGMFAFVLYDTQTKQGWAARDRFGQKPLYYIVEDDAIVLASSAMALARSFDCKLPDFDSYQLFLAGRGFTLPHKSFFKDIHNLPAGHCLTYGNGVTPSSKACLDVADFISADTQQDLGLLSREEVVDAARSGLQSAVEAHALSDVPLGVLLSGGIDSSLVFWHLKDANPDLTGFTKYSPGIEEIPQAVVPELLKLKPSKAITVEASPKNYVGQLSDFIGWAGFAAPWGGGPPMGTLCAAARDNGIKVLLGGDCIDEMAGGYLGYGQSLLDFNGNMMALSDQLALQDPDLVFRPDAITDYLSFNEAVRDDSLQRYDATEDPSDRFLQASLLHDCRIFLQSCVLPNSDAYSMMHSVELRNPFLDNGFAQLTLNLPLAMKVARHKEGIQPKRFLADLAKHDIGPFFARRKEGTRNYSMAVSEPDYWHLSRFALAGEFDLPIAPSKKTMFRLICLEFGAVA
ncbi:asnB [Symbiodinium microadriaticum]|nr:asnB [Symbiodinium microadriaticum]